ncbi:MAG: glycosyltransferase family 39 protein [Nitrospirae bacterium]|nr:glycosyltransferase family 39 protein [Nitrospirota bacterium]
MKKNFTVKPVYFLLAIAFLLRILIPFHAYHKTHSFEASYTFDTQTYITPAKSLINNFTFNDEDGKPDINRTPGYPILLIPGILLGHVEAFTIFLQVLLSCLTVFIVYKISLEIFNDEKAAFFSVMFSGFSLELLANTSILMTETLFTSIFSLFLYFIIRYLNEKKLKYILISVLLLVISIYVRPAGYLFALLFIPFMIVWLLYKKELTQKILIHLIIFLVITVSLTYLWQIRNKTLTGYTKFSAVSDIVLYYNEACAVLSEVEGIPQWKMSNKMLNNSTVIGNYLLPTLLATEKIQFSNNIEAYSYIRGKAIKIILNHPLYFAKVHIIGMYRILTSGWLPMSSNILRTFSFRGITGLLKDYGLKETFNMLSHENPKALLIYLITHIGMALSLVFVVITLFHKGNKNQTGTIAVLIVGLYFSFISGTIWDMRAKHPIIPSICILGGMGMSIVYNTIIRKWMSFKSNKNPNN